MKCYICGRRIYQIIKTKSGEATHNWYYCACGCMQNDIPTEYTEDYLKERAKLKDIAERDRYYFYVYGNLIEELTYGRKALDVGFSADNAIRQLRQRGWLATGIDILKNKYITGDFLTYDFKETFDLIKMTDFLQCVDMPKAIDKAYQLLNPLGVLFITTPNTDLLREDYFPNWGHWDATKARQYVGSQQMRKMLCKYDILYLANDVSRRFPSWNCMHIIARKGGIK